MDFTFPTKLIFITNGYSTNHPAIDIGYGDDPHCPIYAAATGTVTDTADGYGTDHRKGYGNYIRIDHGNGISTIYAHLLARSLRVKNGDRVARGQQIAQMGESGNAYGCHIHFCYLINNVRRDPLLYIKADEAWQAVYGPTDAKYKIMRLTMNPAEKYVVAEDKGKNQLHVTADDLRARSKPSISGEVYGWMPKGFYNAVAVTDADGYHWVKIADDLYAAVVAGYSEYAPAEDRRDEKIKVMTEALNNIIQTAQGALK